MRCILIIPPGYKDAREFGTFRCRLLACINLFLLAFLCSSPGRLYPIIPYLLCIKRGIMDAAHCSLESVLLILTNVYNSYSFVSIGESAPTRILLPMRLYLAISVPQKEKKPEASFSRTASGYMFAFFCVLPVKMSLSPSMYDFRDCRQHSTCDDV